MADENLIVISDEERVLLIAARDYMTITKQTHTDLIKNLYSDAIQLVEHRCEDVLAGRG